MFLHNIKIAFKHIQRQRLVSFINVGGLSIGIASFLLIVLWINNEVSFDRFHKNVEQIHQVAFYYPPLDINATKQPGALPQYLKANYEEVTYASHLQDVNMKLSFESKGFFAHGNRVEADFISIFSPTILRGNKEMLFSDPTSIVLTQSLSRKIFGDIDPINKTIKLDDNKDFTITGIIEDLPDNTHLKYEFLIPFNINNSTWNTWRFKNGDSYVMLAENVDLVNLNSKIRPLIDQFQPEWNNKLFLQPLIDNHLYPIQGEGAMTYIYIYSTIAIIILLIACINFMNLTIAQAEKRQKEIGIKKVSGSSRRQLAVQFFSESLLLVTISAMIAILMVELLLPIINHQLGMSLSLPLSWQMIMWVMAVILVAGGISGSYPAMLLSSLKPQNLYKKSSGKFGNSIMVRKVLVVFQFTLSIIFIATVLLIQKQNIFLRDKNLGYDKENLMMVQSRGELRDKLPLIKQKLLDNEQISNVSVSSNNLFDVMNSGPLNFPGKQEGENANYIEFWYNWVDENFINTLDLEMVEGRFFSMDHASDMEEGFIVNESAIKAMGLEDPIGKAVSTWFGDEGTIIGVVNDYHLSSLHQEIQPLVLLYSEKQNYLMVKLKPGDLQKSISLVGQAIHEIIPDDPFNYHFVDETIEQQYQLEKRSGSFMKLSAVLAIVISALGLFSLSAQTIEKRGKEIGIRKVNGASVLSVVSLLNKEFLMLVLFSFLLASPIAGVLLQKWLNKFAFKTEISIWVFILSGAMAFLIALLTISWQSWSAARRNPVDTLRYE